MDTLYNQDLELSSLDYHEELQGEGICCGFSPPYLLIQMPDQTVDVFMCDLPQHMAVLNRKVSFTAVKSSYAANWSIKSALFEDLDIAGGSGNGNRNDRGSLNHNGIEVFGDESVKLIVREDGRRNVVNCATVPPNKQIVDAETLTNSRNIQTINAETQTDKPGKHVKDALSQTALWIKPFAIAKQTVGTNMQVMQTGVQVDTVQKQVITTATQIGTPHNQTKNQQTQINNNAKQMNATSTQTDGDTAKQNKPVSNTKTPLKQKQTQTNISRSDASTQMKHQQTKVKHKDVQTTITRRYVREKNTQTQHKEKQATDTATQTQYHQPEQTREKDVIKKTTRHQASQTASQGNLQTADEQGLSSHSALNMEKDTAHISPEPVKHKDVQTTITRRYVRKKDTLTEYKEKQATDAVTQTPYQQPEQTREKDVIKKTTRHQTSQTASQGNLQIAYEQGLSSHGALNMEKNTAHKSPEPGVHGARPKIKSSSIKTESHSQQTDSVRKKDTLTEYKEKQATDTVTQTQYQQPEQTREKDVVKKTIRHKVSQTASQGNLQTADEEGLSAHSALNMEKNTAHKSPEPGVHGARPQTKRGSIKTESHSKQTDSVLSQTISKSLLYKAEDFFDYLGFSDNSFNNNCPI